VATVVGTPPQFQADLPEDNPLRPRRIRIFENREVPEVIRYNQDMRYSAALQRGAAPLIFLIAGTGAAHDGSKNVFMAKAFHEQGFHVISLSSPTFPNFVASASETGVPGHVFRDAQDLYRAMEKTWNDIKGNRTATSYHLVGYSLGAFNAAFVANLDNERKLFDFERVLLINPPVSLYNSISLLDRMIENIPGGEDNFDQFFERLVKVFTDVYKRQQDSVGFGDDFLAKVFAAMQPKDEELAALIGVSFRLSSSSMMFTTDVLTDYGFIKPKGLVIDKHADLTRYRQVSSRLGFTDFYHEFFYPYYREEYPDLDRDGFIEAMGLSSIADYLRGAENVFVMHNEDDVILAPGEIDFVKDVFGQRAQIYPVGGHLGNMMYRDNTAHMVGVIAQ
jgi:pimeloyl-ACP methyl ester carboxylesterase